jgi:CheY-like chemotaxis protein
VIEDEEVVRRVVHAALRSFGGCSIDCVADGREALRAIENRSYDLIVSNVRMPNMSGTELYRELLQHRPELTRRLLFATGHVALQEESEDIERWQVPVVAKPFSIESLIEACRPFPAAEPGAKSA